jgi:hypothetical protein
LKTAGREVLEAKHLTTRALTAFTILAAILCVTPASSQEVPGCGTLTNAFGPFDYRDPEAKAKHLPIVETNHFNADVEMLRAGITDVHIIGDIDYTLRAFPNHHRALNSVGRYELSGGRFPRGRIPSADCYFRRAVTFRPDDEVVRMLYGGYLFKRDEATEARDQYDEALRLAPESAEVNYNAGLFYAAQGDLEKARRHAKVAYDGGYPLPGLRKKIAQMEQGRHE